MPLQGKAERGFRFISEENKIPPSSYKAQVQSPRLISGTDSSPELLTYLVVKEGEVQAEFLGKDI